MGAAAVMPLTLNIHCKWCNIAWYNRDEPKFPLAIQSVCAVSTVRIYAHHVNSEADESLKNITHNWHASPFYLSVYEKHSTPGVCRNISLSLSNPMHLEHRQALIARCQKRLKHPTSDCMVNSSHPDKSKYGFSCSYTLAIAHNLS